MTSICMNCENPFIKNGPFLTCAKCHGPCDTYRYSKYYTTGDETFYDTTHSRRKDSRRKDENKSGHNWDNSHELPFRRSTKVPKPSNSTSLKKSQVTDQFRVFGYRIFNVCSRYADPFTWLDMLRDSKSKYDVKTKERNGQTEKSAEQDG